MKPDEVVTEFIHRLVALDFEGAGELVSGDLQYDNVPVGKNHGREAFLGFVTAMMSGFDELEFITHRQTVTGDTVMNERTDRFRVGDQWIELPVAGVFEVDASGQISLWRDYFDLATFQNAMEGLTAAT